MQILLPYGDGFLEGELPDSRVSGIVRSHLDEYRPALSQEELVEQALRTPIGSPALQDLAAGSQKIVIIASDHTRPVPSKFLIPPMLREIRAGNPQADITILIATGCHRGTTQAELRRKFGDEICDREKIVVHDCDDSENLVSLGTLPSGGELIIDRLAAEADLLVSEGFIEPHFFAGFSGGRKSVLPGIAARKTVYANHCSKFIADDHARYGVLEGNPIHRDMIFSARAAKLRFILNVVINSAHEIIGAFAGDCNEAHLAGAEFLSSLCHAEPIESDIVVTSNNGYPLDQNIYQAVKSMATAEMTCRENGVIIVAARCEDGHGGQGFFDTFRNEPSSRAILDRILLVPQDATEADQWQSQIFARILCRNTVILISEAEESMVRALHMLPAHSLEEALRLADSVLGHSHGTITVVPEGMSCLFAD